jgi:hypothetical protein
MGEIQSVNIKYTKKEGIKTSPKVHSSSITKSKDNKIINILDKKFKTLVLKLINEQ